VICWRSALRLGPLGQCTLLNKEFSFPRLLFFEYPAHILHTEHKGRLNSRRWEDGGCRRCCRRWSMCEVQTRVDVGRETGIFKLALKHIQILSQLLILHRSWVWCICPWCFSDRNFGCFFFYRLLATLISLVSVSGLVVQDFLPTSISSLFGTKLSILMLTMV